MDIYEEPLLEALAKWRKVLKNGLYTRGDFAPLIDAIDVYCETPGSNEARRERLLKRVWIDMFEQYRGDNNAGYIPYRMVHALLTKDRWRALFKNAESAHKLVASAAGFIEGNDTGLSRMRGNSIAVKFAAAVSGWLAPGAKIGHDTLRGTASALFGEPWCVLVYDARGAGETLSGLVAATRPEFLAGRLALTTVTPIVQLPVMAC
jgi:hypothetical protein